MASSQPRFGNENTSAEDRAGGGFTSSEDVGTAVLIERRRADVMLRAYGAFLGLAAGNALGAPWSLVRPARADEPIEMRARPGLDAGGWTQAIAPALCLLEAYGVASARLGGANEVAKEYARRLVAWYRGGPQDVSSVLQLVLNDVLQPAPFLSASALNEELNTGAEGQWVQRLQEVSKQRWEATRAAHRFADNHSLPLSVVCGIAQAGNPQEAAHHARLMSKLTTMHPLTLAASEWLAAAISISVGGPPTAAERGSITRAALAYVSGDGGENSQLEAVIERSHLPASRGAGLDALSAVSRIASAVHDASAQQLRRSDLDPVVVALESAVRAGGDTEMVAALVGAMMGANLGVSKLPETWVDQIHGWPGLRADGLRDLVAAALVI